MTLNENQQRTARAAEELRRAARDLIDAQARLDLADDPDLVDAAIYEMTAAEKRLSYVVRQITGRPRLEAAS